MRALQMAAFLKCRWQELKALDPTSRRLLLEQELCEMLSQVEENQKPQLINQAKELFPSAAEPAEVSVPAPVSDPLSLKDLVDRLRHLIDQEPTADGKCSVREEVRAALVAVGLGNVQPPPAPEPPNEEQLLVWIRTVLAGQSPDYRDLFAARIAETIGVGCDLDVERLITAFDEFREIARFTPDPVLSEQAGELSFDDFVGMAGLRRLAARIESHPDRISSFIWQSCSHKAKELLRCLSGSTSMIPSEEKRLGDDLIKELRTFISQTNLYDVQRFTGVKLSPKSKRHLESQPLQGKDLARLNRSLLQDAYPSEIRCLTPEGEVIDELIAALRKQPNRRISPQTLLSLWVATSVELGCLQQFGHRVLLSLNHEVYDPVFGRVLPNEETKFGNVIAALLSNPAAPETFGRFRSSLAVLKSLLYWYTYSSGLAVKPIAKLNPRALMQDLPAFVVSLLNKVERWNNFEMTYSEILTEMTGTNEPMSEEKLKARITKLIEAKVTTYMACAYGWNIKEEV